MRRLILLSLAAAAIALFGALGGRDGAVAARSTQQFASVAPCVGHGVASGSAAATQQTVRHAGLVIVFPKGRVETRCIEFTADSVTGTELLRQSGLPIVFAGFGGLGSGVCRIDDVGCSDPGDCFCQCRGGTCAFWEYFKLENNTWIYSSLGPSQRRLHDGDVDGWLWGAGHAGPEDVRGPCPSTPMATPTVAVAPSTAPASNTLPADGGQTPPLSALATAGSRRTPEPRTLSVSATPSSTAVPQVGGHRQGGQVDAKQSSKSASGEGAPVELISFGVVAAGLVAAIGGLLLWRRRGG